MTCDEDNINKLSVSIRFATITVFFLYLRHKSTTANYLDTRKFLTGNTLQTFVLICVGIQLAFELRKIV